MKRTILFMVGLIISVLVAVVLLTLEARQTVKPIVFPNGCKLTYLGTSVGTAPFTADSRLRQMVRKYLPARFTSGMQSLQTGSCGESNTIALFFLLNPSSGTLPWNQVSIEDSTGFRYFDNGMSRCSFGGGSGRAPMDAIVIRTFPRREKSFVVHFLDWKKNELARMTIPNPMQGPFPEWKPDPLPQIKTNGAVTLSLSEMGDQKYDTRSFLMPNFRVNSSDDAWKKGEVRYWECVDATGNRGYFLSTNEPAWKIIARVVRTRAQDFTPNERMVVTNLSIPEDGKFAILSQESECLGTKIKVQVIASAGQIVLSNNTAWHFNPQTGGNNTSGTTSGTDGISSYWNSPDPSVLVNVWQIQPDDEIEFFTVDKTGKSEKVGSYGWNETAGARTYNLQLKSTNIIAPFNFEVRINRPKKFEFMVNPVDVKR